MAELVRSLYSLAWWLVLPLVLARLWWRGRLEPGYRLNIGERLGFYPHNGFMETWPPGTGHVLPVLWVHAVSVGETRAAEPLINALLERYPRHRIVLTHMTPTGRATGAALYGRHTSRMTQCYLPYDLSPMVTRFIKHYQPQACLLIETEVWPNLVAQCQRLGVSVALVNARLSARSLVRGQRMRGLIGAAARGLACVGAQTDVDAKRLQQLGVGAVTVTGSMKFDVEPSAVQVEQGIQWRQQFGPRKVVLFASTREGEEALIFAALRANPIGALVVVVPRHPQRFDEVATLIAHEKWHFMRRSQMGEAVVPTTVDILLGDSMGEMSAYYAAADIAFIGGSLLPLGGQNLIEACAIGTPVLVGPHTFNFAAVTADAIAVGAAVQVENTSALLKNIQALLEDASTLDAMANAARVFATQYRGATQRTVALLQRTVLAGIT